MTKYILLILSMAFVSASHAQIPQAFSFQSLVLDESGDPVTEKQIGVQIQITESMATGPAIYVESHTPTTNVNGIYTIDIGNGNTTMGDFMDIDWLGGNKFVSVFHDIEGGTIFSLVGSSQLLSVPYALAAGTSFIEPMIYVSLEKLRTTTIDINDPDPDEFVSFRYEWIQGIPETVFIDYSNLPDNIHIRNSFSGIDIDNFSGTDTITDGIVRTNSEFVKTDLNAPLIPGDYIVDMTFRTETEVLAEIEYPLRIVDPIVEEEDDCTEDFVGEMELVEICDTLSNLLGTNISLSRIDNQTVLIENILNAGMSIELDFVDGNCDLPRVDNSLGFILGQLVLEDFQFEISPDQIQFEFLIQVIGEDEMTVCIATYQR